MSGPEYWGKGTLKELGIWAISGDCKQQGNPKKVNKLTLYWEPKGEGHF